ncbi:MAG: chromate transporter [Chloroflexales bacterium]|nr:chromate transporter [Chloroflexales bacterium]
MIDPLIYFWLLLKASFFSTSGLGNLPILYDDLIARGWASERQFAEALAVGQVSPGPSGLWVISLGYLTDGLRGALLALVAICIPPLAVLILDRLHRRVGDHPAMQGFVRGLSLAVIGIFVVVLYGLLRNNGINLVSLLIVLSSLALVLTQRVPVIVVLGLAGLVGVIIN